MLLRRLTSATFLICTLFFTNYSSNSNIQAQTPFDPVGNYELATRVMGIPEEVTILLQVLQLDGAYITNATSEIAPDISRRVPITITGRQLDYQTTTPSGILSITIAVNEDDTIQGTWNFGLFLRGNLTGNKLTEETSALRATHTRKSNVY